MVRKQVEEQQRQELLSGSRSAAEYAMQSDADAQGMSYVDNSKRVLEEAFQTGTAVLTNMSGQRERLKVLLLIVKGHRAPGDALAERIYCCRLPRPRLWTLSTAWDCQTPSCVSLSGAKKWTSTLHMEAW